MQCTNALTALMFVESTKGYNPSGNVGYICQLSLQTGYYMDSCPSVTACASIFTSVMLFF